MGARIAAVAGLCAHLSGPRAKRIHDHFMEAGVRVEAGDRALYSVIEQNCERVDRAAAEGDTHCAGARAGDDPGGGRAAGGGVGGGGGR